MVSTKTQIAGFEFDNCLMNAAVLGVDQEISITAA